MDTKRATKKATLGSGERFRRCVRSVRAKAVAGKKRKRQNPDEERAAAELSEQFHGRPVDKITDVVTEERERYALAELGRLKELTVVLEDASVVRLEFTSRRAVRVAASADGGQLYLVGGDQAVDLHTLGLANTLPKDHIEIGAAWKIIYHTSKAFHQFEPTDYVHEFGEEGGRLPALGYDVLNKRLYLVGGTYQVRPEGIVN